MSHLPSISGKKAVNVFKKAGWYETRREGSHIILTKDGRQSVLSVPDHREVSRGTLRSLIRKSGMSLDDFIALIKD